MGRPHARDADTGAYRYGPCPEGATRKDVDLTQLTTAQAAAILRVSSRRVRQLADSGELAATNTPLGRLFERSAVEALHRNRQSTRNAHKRGTILVSKATQVLVVRVDGSAMPNPGSGGCGFEVVDSDGETVLFRGHAYLGQVCTNPRAELEAVTHGIRALRLFSDAPAVIQTDSLLVVKWLTGEFVCHQHHLLVPLEEARAAVGAGAYAVEWRPRGGWNDGVDALAKQAARERSTSPELAERLDKDEAA